MFQNLVVWGGAERYASMPEDCSHLLQVELSGRKIHAVNKAVPQLPISVEDAARSEQQIAEGEAVSSPLLCMQPWLQ